jgi:uncharacterized protein YdhG (YjbR/CyaY superfamily)
MAKSDAPGVDDYLRELPDERREAMAKIRSLVKKNLPKGYRESMGYGMISWTVPLDRFPDTYNGQPLCYIGLASQKSHMALYLMSAYGNPQQEKFLADAFRAAGKKLDMGKSCLRFRKLDDLPLDAVAEIVRSTTPEDLIARHEAVHGAKKKAKKK